MYCPRALVSLGDDPLQYAFLQSHFDVPTYWFTSLPDGFASENWNRLFVLDVGERGSKLLVEIKQANAGVPVVVLAERNQLPLTQISTAFTAGAEILLEKPLFHPSQLVPWIQECFRRLDHWREVIKLCTLRNAQERLECQSGAAVAGP